MIRTRTIRTILATPILAAAVLTATVSAATPATAQPPTGTSCASMAMPNTQARSGNPNPLTRAGQLSSINAPAASSSTPMNCPAPSHG